MPRFSIVSAVRLPHEMVQVWRPGAAKRHTATYIAVMHIPRPSSDEHPAYALTYIDAAEQAITRHGLADLMSLLARQPADLAELLDGVSADAAARAYAAGKWTLLESLVHTIDCERVFSYRLLRAARGDRTPLPGFEHDEWVPLSGANERTLASVITEFGAVRASTIALLTALGQDALARRTVAGGRDVSARGLAWMIAGHVDHHLRLTRERYLTA